MYKTLIVLCLLFSGGAEAFASVKIKPVVMGNVLHIQHKNTTFTTVNTKDTSGTDYYLNSLNYGVMVGYKKIRATLTTNMFTNSEVEQTVRHNASGREFQNFQSIRNNTLGVGYYHNRFNTAFVISDVNMRNRLNQIVKVTKKEDHDILKGLSFGYFITDKILTSATVYEGSKDLDTDFAISLNIFYVFGVPI